MNDFANLGLSDMLLRGVEAAGFESPTDIQTNLIPAALAGKDVLGQARTGTGKTAAFALPMMERMDPDIGLQGVVVVPTRELAVQVTEEFRSLGRFTKLTFITVYGGVSMSKQISALHGGANIAVATPGRLLDLIQRGTVNTSNVRFTVLDEVDRMLDIGFINDIRQIMRAMPSGCQTILVSATVDAAPCQESRRTKHTGSVRRLAKEFTNDPVEIDVSRDELTVGEVEQVYCTVAGNFDKHKLLMLFIAQDKPASAIVFTNMRITARRIAERLKADGISAEEIRGDLDQRRRESVMARFRDGHTRILVATDVAARGIDIAGVTHIVNYDIPLDAEIYVHRIGRTARMGASGKAVTFVTRDEGEQLTEIEKLIDVQIKETRYKGFASSPPSKEKPAMPTPRPTKVPVPPKTLGGKFRTRRQRRLWP